MTTEEARFKSSETLRDYDAVAAAFDAGNASHDVSQNLEAMLAPFPAGSCLDVLDLGCAGGRDLLELTRRGHRAVGVEGAAGFVQLARSKGCTVREEDLQDLELEPCSLDAVFANAVLFHVPRESLQRLLGQIQGALRDGGVFFSSNAHGFGEDKEGWTHGRTQGTRSWVCWLSEESWVRECEQAGFELQNLYYRPPGRPREQQPFLATVWRKVVGESSS
eukprot:TRINITY_DN47389_c0_g1_i1.p1 TRINITY_DN47389_c0_g1~~TRINITY_DN47389_c0_g1_i1.p1  ORF type:complete len:220 (+),score=49.41 TRINITY_DN47389_c0_g1_i1:68-727(+)